ncbi:MAG: M24 family metallopeptidase [Ignavibacteriales bacterium]
MSSDRLVNLRGCLRRERLDAVLLSGHENCIYISGFTGEGHVLVALDAAFVLTDSRYAEQAGEESPAFELLNVTGTHAEAVAGIVARRGIRRLGLESEHLTYKQYTGFAEAVAGSGCETSPVYGVVEEMREIKSDREIDRIRAAGRLACEAFKRTYPRMASGITESAFALELDTEMRRMGAEGPAFPTIVASGRRGSLPHAKPSDKVIEEGDMVTVDFGAVLDLYCSDMTRTIAVGDPPPVLIDVYGVVREAQQAALARICPGMTLREADAVAREIIRRAGYGDQFGHGLGHGVGLSVHESPKVSPKAPESGLVRKGMVITVEPGVYLPGIGGVRIEDTVRVGEGGVEALADFPRDLIVL